MAFCALQHDLKKVYTEWQFSAGYKGMWSAVSAVKSLQISKKGTLVSLILAENGTLASLCKCAD